MCTTASLGNVTPQIRDWHPLARRLGKFHIGPRGLTEPIGIIA